jgi:toxin ParE1/3/4
MQLEFRPQAERDLESIGDYIAQDNPRRAVTFLRELRAQCHQILLAPKGYRLRPELGEGIRSCAHGNYVIFFTECNRLVTVIRVLHGAMDIEARFPDKAVNRPD